MNYVLLSVKGRVGRIRTEEKDGESTNGGGRAILYQMNILTRFMMRGKMTTSGSGLSAEKAESNRGRDRESGPGHPPQEGWVGQVEASREAGKERDGQQGQRHHGGYGIPQEEGGVLQRKEGTRLYIKGPNPN